MFHDFLLGRYIVHLLIGLGIGAVLIDVCFWLWEKYRWEFAIAAGVASLLVGVTIFCINPRVDTRHVTIYFLWLAGCALLIIPSAKNADWEDKSKKKLI